MVFQSLSVYVHTVCLCVAQCVLGCSSQPIEVSRSIIKACHWLVHELGRPIRATDVRSEWKRVRVAVKRRREWGDKERQSLGLRVREMTKVRDGSLMFFIHVSGPQRCSDLHAWNAAGQSCTVSCHVCPSFSLVAAQIWGEFPSYTMFFFCLFFCLTLLQ